jgi:predicted Rossmann fold nucleotide-binding protein DprA/Smf involved in DNA uptake
MTDQYQREWIEEHESKIAEKQALEKEKAKKKQTKTVTPAKKKLPKKATIVDKDPKSLFKMSKFTAIGPKISSCM